MYRERPSRQLAATVWHGSVVGASGEPGERRILPDGCMDVVWADGQLVVAGPDTAAKLFSWAPGASYVGLRFDSGVGPALLGVAAHEVRDQRVPLADVWGSGPARELAGRLAEATDDPAAVLEAAVVARPPTAALADEVVPVVMLGVARRAAVADLARAAGLSERQLHRRCQVVFGYGPKTLARIVRMQEALRRARAGTPFAEVAVASGYADQPHLARDVRALAGVPLGDLAGRSTAS